MNRGHRSSRWVAVSVVSAVVALAALGGLALWALAAPGHRPARTSPGCAPPPRPPPRPSTAAPSAPVATPSPTAPPQPKTRDASLGSLTASAQPAPTRLVIKALGVDARVDDVGVQDDGAMVIPAAPTSVGWYRYGAAPSDARGNTVIAGHVATREDGPGALAPLRGAKPGMRVTVTTADGTNYDYKVLGREAIVKKALPVDEIFARDGRPLLVLITCGGEYLPELRSHRDNIIVTAVPVR